MLFGTQQIETPVIQSFDDAMSEEEWTAYNENKQKEVEDIRVANEKAIQQKWEAEQKEKEDREVAEAKRKREEELKKVGLMNYRVPL